jgi:Pyruvate/2-oxoacid:ferredoxin oxidoreductase gamma subunit
MSKTDHGTTDVVVGSEIYTLNFNLKAVKRIERHFGGIAPALQEVQKLSLGVAAVIIAAGAGLTLKPKEFEALEEEIYDAGIGEVTPPLVQFLVALLNPAAKTAEELEKAAEEPEKKAKK